MHVRQGLDRQPRGDRPADDAHTGRARDRERRRPLGGRRPRAARPPGGRGVRDRPGARRRQLPARRSHPRRRPRRRASTRSIPATGSSPRTRSSHAPAPDAGIVFIGPPPEAIEAMGSKTARAKTMQAAGVPIVPGTTAPVPTLEDAAAAAEQIGYPVALKAAGGVAARASASRGPRPISRRPSRARPARRALLRRPDRLRRALPRGSAPRRGPDPRRRPRQRRPPGERDCSIQRRHQKLIEESPAAGH